MFLDYELLREVASHLSVSEAFVEKDWYAVNALKIIAENESDTIETIFSGGTSLSKGHGIIKRFSEDLDFRCRYKNTKSGSAKRTIRRTYRENIIKDISANDTFSFQPSLLKPGSNFFKFPLGYPQKSVEHASLRPDLEIEFSFTQPRLPATLKPIQSFVSEYIQDSPETKILCLSPIEIGADKLSALTWRIIKRNRGLENDDPTIIRHLHDLSSLYDVLSSERDAFINTAQRSFETDQLTTSRNTNTDFLTSTIQATQSLKNDTLYQQEYQQFARAMSYATDSEQIELDEAISRLESIVKWF